MIVGLPGTGIGGLFYALMAIMLPIRTAHIKMRKKNSNATWALAFRQVALALLIAGAMWLTGEVIGRLVALFVASVHHTGISHIVDPRTISSGEYNMVKLPFLYWTFAVVVGIHLVMQAMRFIVRMSRSFAR